MSTDTRRAASEAAIWTRVIHPEGEISPAVARAIVELSFSPDDTLRMRELSAKANAGKLTAEENAEMDNFERVGAMLSVLKSKARLVLKEPRRQV